MLAGARRVTWGHMPSISATTPSTDESPSATFRRMHESHLHRETLSSASTAFYARIVKPLMDRIVAAILLLLTSPLMLVIALVVYMQLGRPVLLRQTRVGLHGRPFRMWKFRTMRPDRRRSQVVYSGVDKRRLHKSLEDPRHVPVGRLLRKWSLDELPQLLNVLSGEMSLVGPRPELPHIIERHYTPQQLRRHEVKPGVTGLWQVTRRGTGPMYANTDADLTYINHLSLRQDCRILLLTLPAVLGWRHGE